MDLLRFIRRRDWLMIRAPLRQELCGTTAGMIWTRKCASVNNPSGPRPRQQRTNTKLTTRKTYNCSESTNTQNYTEWYIDQTSSENGVDYYCDNRLGLQSNSHGDGICSLPEPAKDIGRRQPVAEGPVATTSSHWSFTPGEETNCIGSCPLPTWWREARSVKADSTILGDVSLVFLQ